MSDKTTSQAQHDVPGWKHFAAEQATWTEGIFNELSKLEAAGSKQAITAIDEMSRLARESLAYGLKMSAEWRKMSTDSMKKAVELFNNPRA